MPAFEIIEHTADIGIRAFGDTEAEVFENAATGMFSLICDLEKINQAVSYAVEVEAEDRETLLVEWLNELLYLYESREVLLTSFKVNSIGDNSLSGMAYGEPIDRGRHDMMTDIKAATYHMLKVMKTSTGWTAEVIFDV